MQENLSILHSLSLSKDEQIAIFTLCALLPIPRHSTLSRPPERSTEKSENPKGGRVFLHLAPSPPGAHAQENVGGFQGSQEASEEESTQGCEGVVKSPKGQVVRDSGSIQSSNGLGFSLALKELIGANDVSLRFPLSKADFTGLSSPTLDEDEVPSSGPGRQSKRRRLDEGGSSNNCWNSDILRRSSRRRPPKSWGAVKVAPRSVNRGEMTVNSPVKKRKR